jgi:hypothetical protein
MSGNEIERVYYLKDHSYRGANEQRYGCLSNVHDKTWSYFHNTLQTGIIKSNQK